MDELLQQILCELKELKTGQFDMQENISDLKADIVELKTDVADLKTDIAGLKTDVTGLKTDMFEVKQRVTDIELTQENIIVPGIRLLSEGHDIVIDRFRAIADLPEKTEHMQTTVEVLTQAVKQQQ